MADRQNGNPEAPKRVLVITEGGLQFGGISSFLYTFYRFMDQEKVQMDFLFTITNSMGMHLKEPLFQNTRFYESQTLKLDGGNSVGNYLRSFSAVSAFLKEHPYDTVHINTGSELGAALWTSAARFRGVKTRLVHSHNALQREKTHLTPKRCLYTAASAVCRSINRSMGTRLLSCSVFAGEFMFGKAAVRKKEVQVVRNAIDTELFAYSAEQRKQLRQELHIAEDTLVFCHVGVFARQKNHSFLLDVFREIHRRNPNTVLWLIGDAKLGPYKPEAIEKTEKYGLRDCVRFLGEHSDVNELMQAADALVFPSVYEGLGIVAIEAQAAGLPVFASTGVPEEAAITDLMRFLPLEDGADAWAEWILREMAQRPARRNTASEIAAQGYDARTEAKELERLYLSQK